MTFVFMMCIGRVWKDLLKIVGAGTEDTQIGGEINKKKVHEKFLMNLKTTVA